MSNNNILSVCNACESARIDGGLVPAGEYPIREGAELSHGIFSSECGMLAYGDDAEYELKSCPTPSKPMGKIIHIPNERVVLPTNFFGIVARGYKILNFSEGFLDEKEEVIRRLKPSLIISATNTEAFESMGFPVIPEYSDQSDLLRKLGEGLRGPRQEHYRKHFT